MKLISCEKLEKSMVELQFSIDAETFKSAVNAAFKREGKKYAIPGFRKGKAPKAMIEKMYGKDLFQYDAINDLFPENYEAAVKEAGIEVVGRPDPEVVSMSEDEGATWKRINDDNLQFGGTGNGKFVYGDWNVYGRVYMSTLGLGVVYGDLIQ